MILERLIKIIDYRLPKKGAFTHLEELTGIDARSWGHAYNGRTKLGSEHLEQMCKLFPEYTLWLMTGMASPETGQTSPEIEQLQELEKRVSK